MATIRKVRNKWRAEVRKRGEYDSRTFTTKVQAKLWADGREKEIESGIHKSDHTLGELCARYSREESPKKKGARWEKIFLKAFSRTDFAELTFKAIDRHTFRKWQAERVKQVQPDTVNREHTLLSSVFQYGIEIGWTSENPLRQVKKLKKGKPRDRRITPEEEERIPLALGFDGEVTDKTSEVGLAFLIALETAMRLGELVSIKPENMHLNEQYVRLIDTKNGESRDVPLSKRAVELFKLIPDGFTVPMESASALFRRKCRAIGITDLHFHDTRREALTRLSAKVDVMTLARISGHRDLKILLNVYYSPKASDMAKLLD